MPRNHFGLCTGMPGASPARKPALTSWLAERIDEIAGLRRLDDEMVDPLGAPLTFGMLYGKPDGKPPYPENLSAHLDAMNETALRQVNLEMVTTDVTAGRPYRLPFSTWDKVRFFYDAEEFEGFFPAYVVRRMAWRGQENKPAQPETVCVEGGPKALMPFPAAHDLPIIVAARMSVSIPILFSAVPLYRVAASDGAVREKNGSLPKATKTWFSDGGLSSNIPIHFFDGPIPRWPTFALNLRGFPIAPQPAAGDLARYLQANPGDEQRKVFSACDYDPDVDLYSNTVQTSAEGRRAMFAFVNSLLDATRNWNDNTLMQLDGYRERTVEIAMSSDEGGLKLTMPQATIQSVMSRGYFAGRLFSKLFGGSPSERCKPWQDHRHIRMRTALLMQSEWLRKFALAWKTSLAPPYTDLIREAVSRRFPYPYQPSQADSAIAFAEHLARTSDVLGNVTFTDMPEVSPELRARPRV